ncbi:MAG: YgiQ family radical SAM protein [Deltaproteobacteria bacterium]|nr:YgiQ family radical SAM protein [Deltaproteobacteria bacterium]
MRHRPFRADLRPAPLLPTTRAEMDALGWDACDVVLVTGDAYVDLPSFGMAIIGRLLESQGFRVGILPQPDWRSAAPFRELGRPRVFFGVTAGNMDSMVNRYTSDRRLRHDDAYTPDGEGGKRPDRALIVYAQRCREAYPDVPLVVGGIEASLRRIAHYDYWSEKVRRSALLDAKADILIYGNAERALVEVAHRLAAGEPAQAIDDLRGTVVNKKRVPDGWVVIDSRTLDTPGRVDPIPSPYAEVGAGAAAAGGAPACETSVPEGAPVQLVQPVQPVQVVTLSPRATRARTVLRLPDFEAVAADPVLYAHASRVFHRESNPHNARALVQRHGDREVWVNRPPIPLTTEEMDFVYGLPYARRPHPRYGSRKIPAYEMIRFSVTIQRGCFGGCTFCSITEHEGRIIQNRSEASILRELEDLRDRAPGFTGVVSDLGGPTANMYRLACKSREIEAACRKPSCVYPAVCENLGTDHGPLIQLYRKARALPGIKKVLIASGVRYDLAVEDPRYVEELVTHHVGGYLKIAPEHLAEGPLSKMMKPGMGAYDKFKALFDKYSARAGKRQYLIPYFIAAHPGTTDADMLELALWLKRNGFKADQVQTFLPSPMATATAMYHSGKNPLRKVARDSEEVHIPRGLKVRRLHKAFLRWHDPEGWPMLREALVRMGRQDVIGDGPEHLIPWQDPTGAGARASRPERGKTFTTQHQGVERAVRPARRRR